MIDFQTPHRKAWLQTLQPKSIAGDIVAVVLGALALFLALFI